MFIGREEELELLKLYLGKETKHALLLYGKRRVGKSTLIVKAVENVDCKVIYFECLQSSVADNLMLFEAKIKDTFKNKYLHFETFVEAFDYLGTLQEKVIIIIDEYSYLKEVGNGKYIDSMFQSIVDQMQDNIDLVLLGSYVSVMKELTEYENPLFGRFSLVLKLKPFDYKDASLFYPKLSTRKKVENYCVFGGLPFANALLKPNESLEENIKSLFLSDSSPLRMYLENVLLKELSKVAPANMILAALANGKKKYGELESIVKNNSTGALDKQLKNLIDMEVIKKVYPINKPNDKKKTFYEIDDNLVRFYYSFVYGHTDVILRIGAEAYYELYIKKGLKTFIAHRFEAVAREYFSRLVRTKKLKGVYDIGTFWYDVPKEKLNGEFDCVLKLEDGYAFYEVKLFENKLSLAEMEQEAEQIKKLAGFVEIKKIGFIALNGFEAQSEQYQQIDGEEMYTNNLHK